jgi:hypothetical protein
VIDHEHDGPAELRQESGFQPLHFPKSFCFLNASMGTSGTKALCGRAPDASGSRHTTQPAHAGVSGHHTTVSPLFFIAYPQTQVPAPSVPGPCADTTAPVPQPILDLL